MCRNCSQSLPAKRHSQKAFVIFLSKFSQKKKPNLVMIIIFEILIFLDPEFLFWTLKMGRKVDIVGHMK